MQVDEGAQGGVALGRGAVVWPGIALVAQVAGFRDEGASRGGLEKSVCRGVRDGGPRGTSLAASPDGVVGPLGDAMLAARRKLS